MLTTIVLTIAIPAISTLSPDFSFGDRASDEGNNLLYEEYQLIDADVTAQSAASAGLLDGTYSGIGERLRVVIENDKAEVTYRAIGCIGHFEADVVVDNNEIEFVGPDCTISITKFGPDEFYMDQGLGCTVYHGAACDFNGHVRMNKYLAKRASQRP
jgi:hypothetical protein